jgi:hypothetical protein
MENKYGGLSVKLESLPINFDGWLNTREPKPRETGAGNSKISNAGAGTGGFDDMESDVPF